MTLWGAKVSSNKPVILESTESRALSVTRAALVRGSEAVLNIEIEGAPFTLGTLRKDKKSNFELDLNVWEGNQAKYSVSVTGIGSEVHLTGYYHPPNEMVDDESSDIEDELPDLPAGMTKGFLQKQKTLLAATKENNVTKEKKKDTKKKEKVTPQKTESTEKKETSAEKKKGKKKTPEKKT